MIEFNLRDHTTTAPLRPCDVPGCERRADWMGQMTCCPHVIYECAGHMIQTSNWIELTRESEQIVHAECGGSVRLPTWVRI